MKRQRHTMDQHQLVIAAEPKGASDVPVQQRRRYETWQIGLVVAFIGTLAYYLPLLGALLPGHAHWPGFMLTGDQRMGYFPAFVEGYRRFWHGGLLGIDFFTNDGASIFAYRPNLMPFYPPYILAYLLADCSNLRTGMLSYVVITVLHQFAGLYCTFVFVRRYLGLPGAAAVLAATIYTLSWYTGAYGGESTFYFQIMLLPAAACSLCWLMQTRSRLAPIWISPVFVVLMLSNYGPTMLASLGLAVVASLIAFALWIDAPQVRRLRALTRPILSLVLAGLVCAPYFYAQVRFKAVMAPTADDIDPVAHNLALTAMDLLNGLSQFIDFRRTHYEAILAWGAIPVFICLFGLDTLIRRRDDIRPRYLIACGAGALVYLAVLLPTFGSGLLAAADSFYYIVPFLGKMHIFQRYLMFGQFFFAIAVAALATVAVLYAPASARRGAAYAGIALWLGVTIACQIWPPSSATDVNALLIEMFLMAVAAVTLAAATPTSALLVVSVLAGLTGLNIAYAIPLATNRIDSWTVEPDPLGPEIRSIVDFVKTNSNGKALAKVAIASSDIESYFNRNLPWLLGSQAKLMNFQGYPPHLANVADYASKFGAFGTFGFPWLSETGLDFVFWSDAAPDPMKAFTDAGYTVGPILPLPGGRHLGKVLLTAAVPTAPLSLLDLSPDSAANWPKAISQAGWTARDGRLVKAAGEQSQVGYAVATSPGNSYEVDLDVEAATPGQVSVALASQVLGLIDVTGSVHFSKRVDASAIGDLWITALPSFTGAISNVTVKALPPPPPPPVNFDNGILRYSGAEGGIKYFGTNYTTQIRTIVDAAVGGTVTYLLWPNPYMVPYVDGVRSRWVDPAAKPVRIHVEPGRHVIEVRFVSPAGVLFVWSQIIYLIIVGAAAIGPIVLPRIRRYRHSNSPKTG